MFFKYMSPILRYFNFLHNYLKLVDKFGINHKFDIYNALFYYDFIILRYLKSLLFVLKTLKNRVKFNV